MNSRNYKDRHMIRGNAESEMVRQIAQGTMRDKETKWDYVPLSSRLIALRTGWLVCFGSTQECRDLSLLWGAERRVVILQKSSFLMLIISPPSHYMLNPGCLWSFCKYPFIAKKGGDRKLHILPVDYSNNRVIVKHMDCIWFSFFLFEKIHYQTVME